MKFIFLLNFFAFFLFSFIKNDDCVVEDSFEINEELNAETIGIRKECRDKRKYIIKANIKIPKIEKYDLIKFNISSRNTLEISKYSFYLDNDDTKTAFLENTTSIELQLSDIILGDHILKIFVENSVGQNNLNLKYYFSNYSNTKRFRDNDNYILSPGDNKILKYEYGRNKNKIVFFKALGNSIKDFNFKYDINDGSGKKTISKTFFNGYSLIIRNEILSEEKRSINFYFDDNDEELYLSTSLKDNEEKYINTINNHFEIILLDQKEEYKINLDIEDSEKYIFKFTTYTKNIIANFMNDDDKKEYQFKINEESSYYIIDNNNNSYSKVIFSKTGNEEYTTLSFDVYKLDDNNYYNIIRGLPQRNILYNNTIAFYNPIYPSRAEKAVINCKIIKGHPNFYIGSNSNDDILTDDKISSVNGYISYKYQIDEKKQIKVDCFSEECIFDIDMKCKDEITNLNKNYKTFSFLEYSYSDKYQININNEDNNYYLLINIHYLIHEPKIAIDNLKDDFNKYKIDLILFHIIYQ